MAKQKSQNKLRDKDDLTSKLKEYANKAEANKKKDQNKKHNEDISELDIDEQNIMVDGNKAE